MKKWMLIPVALLIAVIAAGAVLDTQRDAWNFPQDANGTDDTLVGAGATTMKYANIPTARYVPGTRHNGLEIAWTMGANAQGCVAYLYAARRNGDITLVWTATLTAGTQESTSSRYYVDTIASSTATWATGVTETNTGGANTMSRILLDTLGYTYFFFQYTGLSSETIQAQYSGF